MIQPGQELLHYRLVEQIGEGGMGVVWLARDTSLDRDVAIKLLPASFAADPMRMARFEREAKLLASLNHPNIAAVHGLHEAPAGEETVRFIAMEYVPGEEVIRELPHASGSAWSPDDRLVAISLHGKVHVTNVDGQVVAEIDRGFMGQFSPDGHWITYGTDQGGVYETIVSSWPDREQTYSIQTDGGIEGIWSRGSRELFYRLGNRWYATETTLGDSFEWKQPQLAFEIPFLDTPGRSYAVTSDGQRLYTIVQAEEDVVDRIRVVSGGMPSPSSDR